MHPKIHIKTLKKTYKTKNNSTHNSPPFGSQENGERQKKNYETLFPRPVGPMQRNTHLNYVPISCIRLRWQCLERQTSPSFSSLLSATKRKRENRGNPLNFQMLGFRQSKTRSAWKKISKLGFYFTISKFGNAKEKRGRTRKGGKKCGIGVVGSHAPYNVHKRCQRTNIWILYSLFCPLFI